MSIPYLLLERQNDIRLKQLSYDFDKKGYEIRLFKLKTPIVNDEDFDCIPEATLYIKGFYNELLFIGGIPDFVKEAFEVIELTLDSTQNT